LSANQPAVLFSHTKLAPATTSQSAILFSHNKSAPATSHSQANTAWMERDFSTSVFFRILISIKILVTPKVHQITLQKSTMKLFSLFFYENGCPCEMGTTTSRSSRWQRWGEMGTVAGGYVWQNQSELHQIKCTRQLSAP